MMGPAERRRDRLKGLSLYWALLASRALHMVCGSCWSDSVMRATISAGLRNKRQALKPVLHTRRPPICSGERT